MKKITLMTDLGLKLLMLKRLQLVRQECRTSYRFVMLLMLNRLQLVRQECRTSYKFIMLLMLKRLQL